MQSSSTWHRDALNKHPTQHKHIIYLYYRLSLHNLYNIKSLPNNVSVKLSNIWPFTPFELWKFGIGTLLANFWSRLTKLSLRPPPHTPRYMLHSRYLSLFSVGMLKHHRLIHDHLLNWQSISVRNTQFIVNNSASTMSILLCTALTSQRWQHHLVCASASSMAMLDAKPPRTYFART